MQPMPRRATCIRPVKMLFSAISHRVGVDFADDGGAVRVQHGVRVAAVRGGQRRPVVAGGVQDAVPDVDGQRIVVHLVADHLDGAEDAALDRTRTRWSGPGPGSAPRASAGRTRAPATSPARACSAAARPRPTGPVTLSPRPVISRPSSTIRGASPSQSSWRADVERVGPVAVPVEQPDHRPCALGGAHLQPVAGIQVEVQLLLVGAAVRDLDDAVGSAAPGPPVVLPVAVRVHDPLVASGRDRPGRPSPPAVSHGRAGTRRRPCRRRTRSGR